MHEPYRFGVVGAGWRAEFFLRIVAAMPERFELLGLVTRNQEKGALVEQRWGVPTYRSAEAFLDAHSPEFVVGSVSYHANFEVNLRLLDLGLPLLSETPPAATLE